MNIRSTLYACAGMAVSVLAIAAEPTPSAALPPLLPPGELLQRLQDSWPTYSGDYTGQRYSALKAVDRSNVTHRSLAWTPRLSGEVRGPSSGARARGTTPFRRRRSRARCCRSGACCT